MLLVLEWVVVSLWCLLVYRKVDDLQFAVEETAIDKGDLEVTDLFPHQPTEFLFSGFICFTLYVEAYRFSSKSDLITVCVLALLPVLSAAVMGSLTAVLIMHACGCVGVCVWCGRLGLREMPSGCTSWNRGSRRKIHATKLSATNSRL